VSKFKGATRGREVDATTATAHLPGLDIEIVHRRLPDGDAEQISINLQAAPSFEAMQEATDAARKLSIFGAPAFAVGTEIFWATIAWRRRSRLRPRNNLVLSGMTTIGFGPARYDRNRQPRRLEPIFDDDPPAYSAFDDAAADRGRFTCHQGANIFRGRRFRFHR
jgi:hypothetical protein